MNSRPLTALSDDANDEPLLTPNHFLIGQMGSDFVPESVDTTAFKSATALEASVRVNPTSMTALDARVLASYWFPP